MNEILLELLSMSEVKTPYLSYERSKDLLYLQGYPFTIISKLYTLFEKLKSCGVSVYFSDKDGKPVVFTGSTGKVFSSEVPSHVFVGGGMLCINGVGSELVDDYLFGCLYFTSYTSIETPYGDLITTPPLVGRVYYDGMLLGTYPNFAYGYSFSSKVTPNLPNSVKYNTSLVLTATGDYHIYTVGAEAEDGSYMYRTINSGVVPIEEYNTALYGMSYNKPAGFCVNISEEDAELLRNVGIRTRVVSKSTETLINLGVYQTGGTLSPDVLSFANSVYERVSTKGVSSLTAEEIGAMAVLIKTIK